MSSPPSFVDVDFDDGFRVYKIGQQDVTGDMLHVRYKSTTGDAHGHGPLEVGRARLVAANVLARYASNMAAAGGIPNAVLTHPQNLNATQAADLQSAWVTARMSNMGLPAVLSGGITFETLQLSPKDMALVELAQLTESRIAVLLGVPPFLVGLPVGRGLDDLQQRDVSLFDYHWRAGLRPKAATVTAALSAWLTPRGTRLEVNRDEYVQPAPLRAGTDRRNPEPHPRRVREPGHHRRPNPARRTVLQLLPGGPIRRGAQMTDTDTVDVRPARCRSSSAPSRTSPCPGRNARSSSSPCPTTPTPPSWSAADPSSSRAHPARSTVWNAERTG